MKNAADSPVLDILTELVGAPHARPSGHKRPQMHAIAASLRETDMLKLEQTIEELLEPTVTEEPTLTWEEREAAGAAELLSIYMDALHHPLSDAEFVRSEHIVDTLNRPNP